MTDPRRSPLFRPGGDDWTAIPAGLERLPRSCWLAANCVIAAIIQRSGRMEPVMQARSDRERDRLVMALFTGDDAIEVDYSDRDLADQLERSASFVQKGLLALERHGYCERIGRGVHRRIRLRLPAPEAQAGLP